MYRRELTRLLLVEGKNAFQDTIVEAMKGYLSFIYLKVAEEDFPVEFKLILDTDKVETMFFRYKSKFIRDYVRANSYILIDMINLLDNNPNKINEYYNAEKYKAFKTIHKQFKPTFDFLEIVDNVSNYELSTDVNDIKNDIKDYLVTNAPINYELYTEDYQGAYMIGLSKYPKYNINHNKYKYNYTDTTFDKLRNYYDIVNTHSYRIEDYNIIMNVCELLFENDYDKDKEKIKRSAYVNDVIFYNKYTDDIDLTKEEMSKEYYSVKKKIKEILNNNEDKDNDDVYYDDRNKYAGMVILRDDTYKPNFDINYMFESIQDCFKFYIDSNNEYLLDQSLQYDILKYMMSVSKIDTIKLFKGIIRKDVIKEYELRQVHSQTSTHHQSDIMILLRYLCLD